MNQPKLVIMLHQYSASPEKTFWQWHGNDGFVYSPVFTEIKEAMAHSKTSALKKGLKISEPSNSTASV